MDTDTKKKPVRIAVVGPESTGKTTLVRELARHFDSDYIAEFARTYFEGRETQYGLQDIINISIGQQTSEYKICLNENPYLFCDTNLLVCVIWASHVFGKVPDLIRKMYRPNDYRIHLLCSPDIIWEADPLRENPHNRNELFNLYKSYLSDNMIPYEIVDGQNEKRLKNAIALLSHHGIK